MEMFTVIYSSARGEYSPSLPLPPRPTSALTRRPVLLSRRPRPASAESSGNEASLSEAAPDPPAAGGGGVVVVSAPPAKLPAELECEELCSVSEPPEAVPGYSPKEDLLKVLAVGLSLWVCTLALDADIVAENSGAAMFAIFFLGYAGIIFEETLSFNKVCPVPGA